VALELSDVWTYFADTSCRGYSPLYDRICRAVAQSDAVLDFVKQAPGRAHQPNVLLAAVHYLLLEGTRAGVNDPLAAVYAGESIADVGPLFVEFCLAHQSELMPLLQTRHTNTNEVGRSAVLGPALTTVAAELGEPIALVDVGCSAGLNMLCDRYRLDYGDAGATGPVDAPVQVSCNVVGGEPPIAPLLPPIVERVGIDLDPVDVRNDDDRRWQLACVWPDTGRLPRTRLALDELRRTPPRIMQGDAVATVHDVVFGLPSDATAVVTTTWALAYLSKENRIAFRDELQRASLARPVAWISGEGSKVVADIARDAPSDAQGIEANILGLTVFRGGERDAQMLAFVHGHGTWIDWRPSK
jgi:hypothetical protein